MYMGEKGRGHRDTGREGGRSEEMEKKEEEEEDRDTYKEVIQDKSK